MWMIDRVGWNEFVNFHYPTYPRITLEFLSSLSAVVIQGKEVEEGRIKFRMMDDEYSMTLREFNEFFSFPCEGERQVHRNFNDSTFWRDIARDPLPYDSSRSKSSHIQNPIFRYLHRFMAHTIFGRWESVGVARQSELQFLWAMINNVNIDAGAHFIRHLVKIGNCSTGTIVIGGLLTRIAVLMGYDLSGLEIAQASPYLDLEACMSMRMIGRDNEGYCLLLKDNVRIPIPNPERTSIHNRANWLLLDAQEEEEQEPLIPVPRDPSPPLPGPSPTTIEPSYPEPEPPRTSFAFSNIPAGSSAFDFSEFRSTFEAIRAEHSEHRAFWEQHAGISESHYQQVEQYLEKANRFHEQAENYFRAEEARRTKEDIFQQEVRAFQNEQRERWKREEEHRNSTEVGLQKVDHIYAWFDKLCQDDRFPRFKHGPPY